VAIFPCNPSCFASLALRIKPLGSWRSIHVFQIQSDGIGAAVRPFFQNVGTVSDAQPKRDEAGIETCLEAVILTQCSALVYFVRHLKDEELIQGSKNARKSCQA
jgi:hypothetical protein